MLVVLLHRVGCSDDGVTAGLCLRAVKIGGLCPREGPRFSQQCSPSVACCEQRAWIVWPSMTLCLDTTDDVV